MAKPKPDMDSGLSWLGTILRYIKEYGFFNIIKSCILLVVITLTLKICYDPIFLFEKYNKYMEGIHRENQGNRLANDSIIQKILPNILREMASDRIWIVQYHNGISDWEFGSMRFERCQENIASIKRHYDNFHLSWLELHMYLKEYRYYINTVDSLKEIDCALHDMLLKRNVKFIAVIEIKKGDTPLGVLGATWEYIPNVTNYELLAILNRYSGRLEELLHPQVQYL